MLPVVAGGSKSQRSQIDQAAAWDTQLAIAWLGEEQPSEGMFYVDGHMRVYHGQQTKNQRKQTPRHVPIAQLPPT